MDVFGFWLFLSTIVGGTLFASAHKRRTKHETLRSLIARGEPADTALIDQLLRDGRVRSGPSLQVWFRIGAVLVAFVAPGLALMALLMHGTDPASTAGLLGMAGLSLCLAAGLYCASLLCKTPKGDDS